MAPRNRGCFDPLGSARQNVEREGYWKTGSSFHYRAPGTNTQTWSKYNRIQTIPLALRHRVFVLYLAGREIKNKETETTADFGKIACLQAIYIDNRTVFFDLFDAKRVESYLKGKVNIRVRGNSRLH